MPISDSTLILPQFKASTTSPGVWSPGDGARAGGQERAARPGAEGAGSTPRPAPKPAPRAPPAPSAPSDPPFNIQEPVWTPKTVLSPTAGRKQFRPVKYDTDSLKRQKSLESAGPAPPPPEESFAWSSPATGGVSSYVDTGPGRSPRAPARPQNRTVVQLQQGRDTASQRSAKYLPLDDSPPLAAPNQKLYTIKREYEQQTDGERRRFADLAQRPVEGVGPTTVQGMPVAIKSAIKEEHHPEWYKRMYESLHRSKPDCVKIYYRTRGGYNYPSGGYASEPEIGYESDTGKRFGSRSGYESDTGKRFGSGREAVDDPDSDYRVSSIERTARYKNQPGRIEDYLPGKSSLAEREAKDKGNRPLQTGDPKSFTRAVLDGYDSDSTLVFHRRDPPPISPAEQRSLYSRVQQGGDVPLTGLRKSAPEKPREPVIGPIPKSMSTSAIPERGSPQHLPRSADRCDSAGGGKEAEWREQHAQRYMDEERRRRHLLELEDMERRRHGDYFTPTQKSPIPLNRYDNLFDDVTLRTSRASDHKMAARALHGFRPINSRELSFSRGDIIFIRRQVDRNWLEGEQNGRIGIFPINYVQVIPLDIHSDRPRMSCEGQARARFNFTAQTPVELSLNKGDLVTVLRRVDKNWYEGRLGSRVGIFPASYVEILGKPLPERIESSALKPVGTPAAHGLLHTSASPAPGGGAPNQLHVDTHDPIPYKSLYKYTPQNEDELELLEGDVIYVVEKCEDGWFVGTNSRSGQFGTFPGNYVKRL